MRSADSTIGPIHDRCWNAKSPTLRHLVAFMHMCVSSWSLSSLPSLPVSGFMHQRLRPQRLLAPIHALPFLETLVLVLGGVILGPVSRIPAGILLIPMFVGAVLQSNGLVEIELPSWLLAVSYLLLGWTIGLRFTREILVYAIRALPKMIVSILMLIAFCGGLAFALVEVFDIDPLTAYRASPERLSSL
jgi:membrane AbrB-like protein